MQEKEKIVLILGYFNILHPGHFRILEFAKSLGGRLVVGLREKGDEDITILDIDVRAKNLAEISYVDEVLKIEKPECDFLRDIKPSILVKGAEFSELNQTEAPVMDEWGGEIICFSGEMVEISAEDSQWDIKVTNSIVNVDGFLERHGFNASDVKKTLSKFSSLKVGVFGDLIVDNYVNAEGVGMSKEDTSLAVRIIDEQRFIGGAGIVASNAFSLASEVHFFCSLGDDDLGEHCMKELRNTGINLNCFSSSLRPTVKKTRIRTDQKTLLRLHEYSDQEIPSECESYFITQFEKIVLTLDLVIFSDFNHGGLPERLVSKIKEVCRTYNVLMIADSQSSSRVGNLEKFKGVHCVTPTEYEARLATKNFRGGINTLIENLYKDLEVKHAFVTLGSNGLVVLSEEDGNLVLDSLPALGRDVKDVAGAGDAFLVGTSLSLATGASIWISSFIGSMFSAIQVSRVGNVPISLQEIEDLL